MGNVIQFRRPGLTVVCVRSKYFSGWVTLENYKRILLTMTIRERSSMKTKKVTLRNFDNLINRNNFIWSDEDLSNPHIDSLKLLIG